MRAETPDQIQIAIFAKAPIAGFAKTRLIPLLGAQGAAALQAFLVRRAVETAIASSLRPVSLWCAPDRRHDLFGSLAQEFGIDLYSQTVGDLGARMHGAFDLLTQNAPTILIGSDCPSLSVNDLESCASALQAGVDAAFIPAEDGGYALIGLRYPIPHLFEAMPWGTNEVMTKTRQRARALRLQLFEGRRLWDIDTPADYRRALDASLLDAAEQ